MSVGSPDAFARTFPRKEWYGGLGRIAVVWALLNGLLLMLLLLEAGLVVGLLVHRGELSVILNEPERQAFVALTGIPVAAPATPDSTAPKLPAANGARKPSLPAGAPAAETDNETAESSTPPAESPEPASPPEVTSGAATVARAAAGNANSAITASMPPTVIRLDDHGILPSVWGARSAWWGAVTAWAYRSFSPLRSNVSALMTLLGLFALTWLVRVWVIAQLRRTCRGVVLEVATRMRRQLHRQSTRLATEELEYSGLSEGITLFREDADRLRHSLFEWLYRSSRYPWELVFLGLALFSVEPLLATQWILLSVLGWWLITRSQAQAERTRAIATDRAQRELRALASSLSAARLVRGYGMEIPEQNQFQEQLQRYVNAVNVQSRVQDDPLWLRLTISIACAALASFLMFVLGVKVLSGEVLVAGAAVFLAAFGAAWRAVLELQTLPGFRSDTSMSADRIWKYLDRLPTVSQAVGAKFVQPLSKSLHLLDVSYRLPSGRLLLDRVELRLTAGRCYAVVSLDPREARAFVSLFPRFIEAQQGRVLFDGEDIAWGTLESIRAETLVVSANDPLLPGTILENIRAGRTDVTLNQATDAAKEARAHSFISRLPQGYETQVDGYDSQLDAGQRFRIALARALLRKPSVLIIEEPADPLDDDTKQLLDDTYDRICAGRTIFFLPTRLATLRRVDDILVLRGGRVEAMGPHSLLVQESPLYRHWEYLRFNEFRHEADSV